MNNYQLGMFLIALCIAFGIGYAKGVVDTEADLKDEEAKRRKTYSPTAQYPLSDLPCGITKEQRSRIFRRTAADVAEDEGRN